ncbi:tetratricopeptide repeat protein [Aggregatilinea lenta]|uniref:tetratricopeptide repeat protein n=1 Tax=Aggregatilinea lenta TaxID=913108 RepID=UPI000E5A929B|nr:tetratricopeptide repeat protein [Aggregatilinea lenta]
MNRPHAVFVSSTSDDLRAHRAAVDHALRELGLHPIMMEHFPAQDAAAVHTCQHYLHDADFLVGIYAHRYGWVPTDTQGGDGERSITALEYDWATARGIPRLCFFVDESHEWPPEFVEGEPGASRLKAFKASFDGEPLYKTFTTPDDLAQKVMAALYHATHRAPDDSPTGWRRPTAPLPAARFVGRAADVRAVSDLLRETDRPVILDGAGGMGKTVLALHLARALGGDFPGGVLWATLGPEAQRAPAVTPAILRAWAQAHPAGRTLDPADLSSDAVRALLAQAPGRLLAVLDDAWFPGPVRDLLKALPDGTAVLVTTRSRQVAVLGQIHALGPLDTDDGSALLRDRLSAAGLAPGDYVDSLRALADQLGGHALALDLAARQIVTHGIAFAERLVRRLPYYLSEATPFRALDLGQGTERDDSLEATLYLSYAPLSPDAKAAFRALGVLAPEESFSARTAFATWDVDPADESALDEAYDTLAALIGAGLIVHEPETGRYRQHLLLHAYARALATRENEHDRALGRYTWHVIHDIAGQFETLPMEQWDAIIGPDLPHVHHVGNALAGYLQGIVFGAVPLEDLAQPDPPDDLLDEIDTDTRMAQALLERGEAFAEAVKDYIFRRRAGEEGLRWLQMGLACARVRDSHVLEGTFLNELGLWHHSQGNSDAALTFYNHSLATAHKVGNRIGESAVLNNIALTHHRLGQYARGLDFYQQSLAICRELHNRAKEGTILNNIAGIYGVLGQYEQALDYFYQALDIRCEVNDRDGESATLNNIADAYRQLGQYEQALNLFEQALAISHASGNQAAVGTTLNNIALVYDTLGEHKRALDMFRQALDIHRKINYRVMEGTTLNNIAGVYYKQGQHERALDLYQQALAIHCEVSNRAGEAIACNNIAVVLHNAFGQTAVAISYLERHIAIGEAIGNPNLEQDRTLLADLRRSLTDAPPSDPPTDPPAE